MGNEVEQDVEVLDGELAPAPAQLPAIEVIQTTPTDLLAVAMEKGYDADTLAKFMDLQERFEANDARKAYAAAMAKCQAEMPTVLAVAENDHTTSYYAKLGQINQAIAPIYTKYGFSVSFNEGVAVQEGEIRTIGRLMHEQGHVEEFFCDLPLDSGGLRGNENKTGLHAKGSTNTYGERYIVKRMFNLSILSEDDDGNAGGGDAPGVLITDDQALQLHAMIDESGLNHSAILREFNVKELEQVKVRDFDKRLARLKKLVEAKQR